MFKDIPIIDFHTHAFPDKVAEKAIPALEAEAVISARLDGKVDSLLQSMNKAGIEKSVLASIATKPEQFPTILEWSDAVRSRRLIPFPSVHPEDPKAIEHVQEIARGKFKGIKLHPYYQQFSIDEKKMLPIYDCCMHYGLILLMHTGFDIAFPHERVADPVKVLYIAREFPDLLLVTSHFGAWKDWREAERLLLGKPIYMDISASFHFMEREQACRFLTRHPKDYLLFGSDSPWDDQLELLEELSDFKLTHDRLEALLYRNARRLLRL